MAALALTFACTALPRTLPHEIFTEAVKSGGKVMKRQPDHSPTSNKTVFRDPTLQRRTKVTNSKNQKQKRSIFSNQNQFRLLHQNIKFTTIKLEEIHLLCEDMGSNLVVITENGFNRQ
ncbi:hypothetical protein J6590_047056 [Homalodisca vitripennis]|nr:hypothetical protein J6590_047056 [Homalodisca vitripennis]